MPPKQKARNLGSNFTTFRYAGQNIAYLEGVADSGQAPVGAGYEFVHPLGYTYPAEIVTARALNGGILTLSIREIWHEEVWQQMAGLARTHDIVEVFNALATQPDYVTCTKIVTPPDGQSYGKTYHQCTVLQVPDGDQWTIETLGAVKTVTIGYTHTTAL